MISSRQETSSTLQTLAAFPFCLVCDFNINLRMRGDDVRVSVCIFPQSSSYMTNKLLQISRKQHHLDFSLKINFQLRGTEWYLQLLSFNYTVEPMSSLLCSVWSSMQEHVAGVCLSCCPSKIAIKMLLTLYFKRRRHIFIN